MTGPIPDGGIIAASRQTTTPDQAEFNCNNVGEFGRPAVVEFEGKVGAGVSDFCPMHGLNSPAGSCGQRIV